jgi:hypothetical protein
MKRLSNLTMSFMSNEKCRWRSRSTSSISLELCSKHWMRSARRVGSVTGGMGRGSMCGWSMGFTGGAPHSTRLTLVITDKAATPPSSSSGSARLTACSLQMVALPWQGGSCLAVPPSVSSRQRDPSYRPKTILVSMAAMDTTPSGSSTLTHGDRDQAGLGFEASALQSPPRTS